MYMTIIIIKIHDVAEYENYKINISFLQKSLIHGILGIIKTFCLVVNFPRHTDFKLEYSPFLTHSANRNVPFSEYGERAMTQLSRRGFYRAPQTTIFI